MYWHLKRVAQRLAELLRDRSFDRLTLAGLEEATKSCGACCHACSRSGWWP
jgi:hypothetical protein